jgi:subfamily B ATP-binding cassette protein MsbA
MTEKTKTSLQIYSRLFKSAKNYKVPFICAILGVIIASLAEAIIYKFVGPKLIDKAIIEKSAEFLKLAPFYILATFLMRGVGDFLGKYFMAFVGRNIVKDHRIAMLMHMLYLPISFFDKSTTGELVSKVNYDAEQVATALSDSVLELFKGIATVIFLLAVMFSFSWQITITVLIIAPILSSYFKAVSKRIRRYSSKVQQTMGMVTNIAHEIIGAHKVIRAFQGINYESCRIKQIVTNNCKQEIKIALVMACSEPVMQFIAAFSLAFLVYIATLRNLHISPGEFIGLFTAMFGLIRPIKQITQVNNVLQRGISAADSIHKLLDEPIELDFGKHNFTRARGLINFKDVNFTYCSNKENKIAALKNILFTIEPGETVALVGGSGGGKSTLISLLPRFYDIEQGQILIDNIDIKDISLNNLRQQISLVTQNVVLFNDTIANNIAYGFFSNTSREEIMLAATAAYVMEFAEKLPLGLDTVIGQDGILLSGGQRQRLAIARAILKNAPILILDEATSALDTGSERYIQEALHGLMRHCTTLVVAHRLSTIEKADKIIVLEQGQIVEFGTHIELLNNNSRYAALQKSQFKDILEE